MSDLLGKRFWRKDGKYKAVSKMLIMKNHFCDSYDNNRPVENRFKSKVTSFWVWFLWRKLILIISQREYSNIVSNLREHIPHQWNRLNNLWYLFQRTRVLRNSEKLCKKCIKVCKSFRKKKKFYLHIIPYKGYCFFFHRIQHRQGLLFIKI